MCRSTRFYAWRSGRLVVACDCGKWLTLDGSAPVCECGLDHATTIRKELDAARQLGDEALHPRHYSGKYKMPVYLAEKALNFWVLKKSLTTRPLLIQA